MGILQRMKPWLALAVTVGFPASAQTLAEFFDDSHLHTVQVRMNPDDWRLIHERYAENTYYRCEFEWRGLILPDVGVRSRGSGTRNPIKPNLGFDFSRNISSQRFLGLKSLVTRNFAQDVTTVHEHLAMKLFQRMGLPYERTSHARLFVNGEYVGVYLMVEPIDSRFLRNRLGEDTGYLYEYSWSKPYRFEYLGEDPALYVPGPIEPKNHEDAPEAEVLVEMIRQVNETSDADFPAVMSRYMDLGMLLRQVAVEQVLSENDGILGFAGLANFYLYRKTKDDKFLFIPWDKDNTFHAPARGIWENADQNVLVRRALQVPELRRLYVDALHEAAEVMEGEWGWLDQEADRHYWMLRDAIFDDTYKVKLDETGQTYVPASADDFEQQYEAIRSFLKTRTGDVASALAADRISFDTGPVDVRAGAARQGAYDSLILTPGSLGRLAWKTPLTEAEAAAAYPLPIEMNFTSVRLGGRAVPLLSVDPNEIVFQVPCEVGFGPQPLVIRQFSDFGVSHVIAVDVRPSDPGILTVLHEDGREVNAEQPAEAGERIVVEGTGFGVPATAMKDGEPPEAGVAVAGAFAALVNGARIAVESAQFVPGKVGRQHIILRWPEGLPGGAGVTLTLEANGETGNTVMVATR